MAQPIYTRDINKGLHRAQRGLGLHICLPLSVWWLDEDEALGQIKGDGVMDRNRRFFDEVEDYSRNREASLKDRARQAPPPVMPRSVPRFAA